MKINLFKIFFYITFILVFFPTFVLYLVPNTNINLTYAHIFSILLYISFGIFKYNYFKIFIQNLLSIKLMKLWIYFLFFCLFTTFIHIILGYYEIKVLYFYIIRFARFYCTCMLIYLLPTLGFFIGIKPVKMLKLFYFLIWITLLLGFIQFFSHMFNITFIDNILDFFSNARQNLYQYEKDGEHLRDRVYSIFSEPATFAFYISITMPFIFKLKKLNINFFKNKYLNITIQKTYFFLILSNLLFTLSPVFIIFGLTEFIILLLYNNSKYIKTNFFKLTFLLLIFLLFSTVIIYINIENIINLNIIHRFLSINNIFKDYDKFVIIERSLATRIYSIFLQFQIGLKNFFIGCGYYNSAIFANKFMQPNQINLTMSLENYVQYSTHPYLWTANSSIFFTTFAETGIIGTGLYLLFIFNNIKFLSYNRKNINDYNKIFAKACLESIIIILILSFYTIDFINIFIWLINGFVLQLAYSIKFNNHKTIKSNINNTTD